ncbi:cysteine proteinase [Polychaeton citri CBS 116435]|uniref:Cysteine proteinase n=1 Tax=Polychaeton citri CBS 116435 TaxID=1314669 RepID=A0A9P4Q863_9PEZI|nr:cysteine proteinase [Polychaeton citri CBS 116435]
MANRPIYSRKQLGEYFDRIRFPQSQRLYDAQTLDGTGQHNYLCRLLKHQIVTVPWENLSQHYSWHRVVDINPSHLFRKIVSHGRNRGGYCMEANTFFLTVLLSLNFQVYAAGARVFEGDHFGSFTHCVSIVNISGIKYMIDVGFGAKGPTLPISLADPGKAQDQVAPASMQVVCKSTVQNLDQSQKVWIYQHRISPEAEWMPIYSFVELEFLPEDLQVLNCGPWRSPNSFFTHKVIVCRFTTSSEKPPAAGADGGGPGSADEKALTDGEINGQLTIEHGTMKWRQRGTKVLERKFQNDAERVSALKQFFGIELAADDIAAIGNSAAEVTAKGFAL